MQFTRRHLTVLTIMTMASIILIISASNVLAKDHTSVPSDPTITNFSGNSSEKALNNLDGNANLNTPTTSGLVGSLEVPLTIDPSEQFEPAIYGDKVVWWDYRNGNPDIYMRDLKTMIETQITSISSTEYSPSIHGNNIVWYDNRNGNWDIYLYNLLTQTETQITSNDSTQADPKMYGTNIVYNDDRNGDFDVYLFNTLTSTETRITSNDSDENGPSIYENKIVYADNRSGKYQIYIHDLDLSTQHQLSASPREQIISKIFKDRVVWQEDVNANNTDIFMYDLTSSMVHQITNDSAVQERAAIFGDIIVWHDMRNGNRDIYMYDLLASSESSITTNASDQFAPAVYGNKVVWADDRLGNWDIFGGRLDNSKAEEYSPNIDYDNGCWTPYTNPGLSASKAMISNIRSCTATFSFFGKKVELISSNSKQLGKLKIYSDQVFQTTIDLYASNTTHQKAVFSKTYIDDALHNLKIEVLRTKNQASSGYYIPIDAFNITR